ncbi:MAG: hypothetical protein PHT69_15005 [Bacteroidales bacterium]|nr:hypothetical protein [Bacteroidales bacterium]
MKKKKCLHCGEEITGRADKKFCDDQCRNSFNNKLNSDNINIVRNINNILRKNRRILESMNPAGKTKVKKDKLLTKGFDLKYHTHTYLTKENAVYYFCYDQGFLELDKEWFLLVKNEKE